MAGTDNIDHDIELQVLRGISENQKQFQAILTGHSSDSNNVDND